MQKDFVVYEDKKVEYYLCEKNIKNINMKISSDQMITVSVPRKTPINYIREFVLKKMSWIIKQLKYFEEYSEVKENLNFEDGETVYLLGKQYKMKISKGESNDISINNKYLDIQIKEVYFENKEYIKKTYTTWLKEFAKDTYIKIVLRYESMLKRHSINIPEVEVRNMKSRWGTCIPSKNKIIINQSLVKTPICCVEYVVLHELSHFKHKNHSKEFYNFMTIFMPDWKERKKILDQNYCGVI